MRASCNALLAFLFVWHASDSAATPIDKIVIVIEENQAFSAVLGSGNAPYLDSLAAGGANLVSMYALTHPSQPNYLEFFSGSNQGVIDNFPLAVSPLSSPNLGAAVIAAGETFTGYSESMPSAGYLGVLAEDGLYARRHNPWSNWQADSPGPNQLSPGANQPFTEFPTDFTQLPRVSIVVPNNAHNSHSTNVSEMDAWLRANLSAYADWAVDNNSLLVVTFDEDLYLNRNHVPTVFYGAGVHAGSVLRSTWTLHNLLRTVSDLVGAAAPGAGAQVQPIVGAFRDDPSTRTISFRQDAAGYAGAQDVTIASSAPTAVDPNAASLQALYEPHWQSLIRFDGLFGAGAQLVPAGAQILSAKLTLHTIQPTATAASTMALHRMRVPWDHDNSWNDLGAGVSIDNVEAAATPDFTVLPNVDDVNVVFDVTASVQAWADGAPNFGWVIVPSGSEAWEFDSSEAAQLLDRPALEITFARDHAADFDNDNAVGAADLVEWTAAFGVSPFADADRDADSDGQDFLLWQRELGSSAAPQAAVPEPTTIGLAWIASAVVHRLARRWKAAR